MPPKTKRNAQPVLQTRPAGRLPSGRPGWAAPAPKPALAQRPPESGPGLTIRALGVPSRRTRAVNHGSCRSALTSQFGVGAGPSLALDSAFQARDIGATSHRKITDNSGHWRSTDPPAQPSLSVIIAGRPTSSTLSRTEEARGSNPLTSTPNTAGQSVASISGRRSLHVAAALRPQARLTVQPGGLSEARQLCPQASQ